LLSEELASKQSAL